MNIDIDHSDKIRKIADDVKEDPTNHIRIIKRFLPIGIMLLLASLLWLYFEMNNKKAKTTLTEASIAAPKDTTTMDTLGLAAAEKWKSTLGDDILLKLPNGTEIEVPKNGFEKNLVEYLSQKCPGDMKTTWFNCDRLLFKTGSSELNEVSLNQIRDLSVLMQAFPNAKFKVGGYTDNVGDATSNQKLSEQRAASVLSAIVSQGLKTENIKSEGYGALHPICPENNTDECREKNRRVAIRVETCG